MKKSTTQKFGSAHTEQKLAKLASYLESYTTAMKNQRFHTVYFDAFAGTGGVEIRGDSMPLFDIFESRKFIEGSTKLALQLENNRFNRINFRIHDRFLPKNAGKVIQF